MPRDDITLDSLGGNVYDPYEAAAARVRRRAPVREPDPLALLASQGGVPWSAFLPDEARAMQAAASLQAGGDYAPRDVLLSALGSVGAPAVGGVDATLATLGSGAIRRGKNVAAPTVRSADAPLFDYSRLRDVPDVPQFNLPRYEPPRGVPERTQELASKANLKRINEVVKRGAQQGGIEWYNTDPLRQAFVAELGEAKGAPAYKQYLEMVASTSPRATVPVNARNASYYYQQAQQGQPVPSVPLPQPYGHIAQKLHIQNARNVLEQGGIPPLQNPKPASFVENLAGNQMPVTIDTHNMRLLTGADETIKPAKTEYGFLEAMQQREAEKLGMSPAQYQASAWIGGGEQTGLKSSADPFLKAFEDRVRVTAEKKGLTPQEVLKRMIRGEMPLLSVGGAAALAAPALDEQR